MPKSHRDLIQRKLAQAYINIYWAGSYLLDLFDEFDNVHPEYAEILKQILLGLDIQTDLLEMFGKKISGRDVIDWQAWAGTGRPRHVNIETNTDNLESENEAETNDNNERV
jgi:hypothetical protein